MEDTSGPLPITQKTPLINAQCDTFWWSLAGKVKLKRNKQTNVGRGEIIFEYVPDTMLDVGTEEGIEDKVLFLLTSSFKGDTWHADYKSVIGDKQYNRGASKFP